MAKKRRFRVQIDPELARLAYVTGHFALYRIWVYATRAIGDGSGWVGKGRLEESLRRRNIRMSHRNYNRLIKAGIDLFWTTDNRTGRIYLSGAERVTKLLTQLCDPIDIETNQPGVRRMHVDLSGSMGDAVAHAYAAWIARKDKKGYGVTISRDALSILWGVSVPTLLDWEKRAKVKKVSNYAQQDNTDPVTCPDHAYLCRAKSGDDFVSWRMPNTYRSDVKSHKRNGNARKLRQSVRGRSRQPATQGVGGSLRRGKLYWLDGRKRGKEDGFKKCDVHLRKHGDVFVPHYVCLGIHLKAGEKTPIRIYERYDTRYNASVTQMDMRDYAAEYDADFRQRAALFAMILSGQRKMPPLKE